MTDNNTPATLTPAYGEEAFAAINAHFAKGKTRKAFESIDSAMEALSSLVSDEKVATYDLPYSIVGLSEDGTVDESVYTGSAAVLAQVRARVQIPGENKKVEVIKAFVVFPVPTLETIIAAGEQGSDFIETVLEKEFALTAFRGWREFDTADEFVQQVSGAPRTLADYLTSSSGNTVDTSTFDDLWPDFRAALQKDYKKLWDMLAILGKGNILKAIRSQSYAESNPDAAPLEANNIFTGMADQLIKLASAEGLDTSALEGWVAKRGEVDLVYTAPKKVEDTSFLSGFAFAQ